MRHRKLIAVSAAALMCLAGCSGGADSEAPDVQESEDATSAPAPAETGLPFDDAPADTIPTAIRGSWGVNSADCDISSGAAKGNLTIDSGSVRFYESVATLGAIEQREPGRIRAQFGFEGEGQTWTMGMDLSLGGNGETLTRRDFGADAMIEPLQYRRCE